MIEWIFSVTPRGRAWLCWDGLVSERKPYPSDLPDERWALIEPMITAWKAAHRQILAVFAETGQPMSARDLCQALDLPIAPKNTENIRSKLKRLASRGILAETEPGLFTQPRP